MDASSNAGQYAWDAWIVARFAADFQVMMYFDGDAEPLRLLPGGGAHNLREFVFQAMFGQYHCASFRLPLVNQFLNVDAGNPRDYDMVCASRLIQDTARFDHAISHCIKGQGNAFGRTDSIHQFDVHFGDIMPGEDATKGTTKWCWEISREIGMRQGFVEIHLTTRHDWDHCKCEDNY